MRADHTQSLGRRAGSGAVWITIEMISVQLVSIIVFAVLAHYIGPTQFGLLSVCYVMVFSMRSMAFENIATAIAQREWPTDLDFTTAFWMTLCASFLSFLALEAFSLVVDTVFRTRGLAEVLRPMGFILISMGMSRTHEMWLSRNFRFRSLALRAGVSAVAGGVVGVASAAAGMGVWALVAQQLVMSLTALACLWLATPWRPSFALSGKTAGEIVRFVRDTSAASALNTLNEASDTVMVASFFGPESVGLYSTGKRLKLALHLIAAGPINGVVLPTIAEVQSDAERLRRVLLSATSIIFILACPIFFGVAAVSRDAIMLFFGAKWEQAAPVLTLLSLSGPFAIAMNYNANVFVIKNKQIWSLYVSGLYTGLSILLFFLLSAAKMKMIALPFVLPYVATFPLSMILMMRLTGIDVGAWLRSAGPPLFAAVTMFTLVQVASPLVAAYTPILSLLIKALLGATAFIASLWLLAKDDMTTLIRTAQTWFRK